MPMGMFWSSLLFGFVNSFAIYIASLDIPSELIQMIPYLITVIALALFAMRKQMKKKRVDEAHELYSEDVISSVVKDISAADE